MSGKDAELIRWMIEQFRLQPHKSRSDLARTLGVDRSVVTKILKGQRKRGILAAEREIIMTFFDNSVAQTTLMSSTLRGGLVVKGLIGTHVWEVEGDETREPIKIGTPILDHPIEEQSLYELAATSRDGDLRKGDYIYAVPFETYRVRPLADDLLIVRRRQGRLVNYSLVRAVRIRQGVGLQPVFAGDPDNDDGDIVGLVIGTYRPIGRRI
jgi:hypothetical protein